jgi:hypothetical protein
MAWLVVLERGGFCHGEVSASVAQWIEHRLHKSKVVSLNLARDTKNYLTWFGSLGRAVVRHFTFCSGSSRLVVGMAGNQQGVFMQDDPTSLVPIKDYADHIGRDRSALLKAVKKSGIQLKKVRDRQSGQTISVALRQELDDLFLSQSFVPLDNNSEGIDDEDGGVFYFVQVMPNDAPDNVTTGFTISMSRRILTYQTAWHEAQVIHTWPARKHWEPTAQDALEKLDGVIRIGEQFIFPDIKKAIKQIDTLFDMLFYPLDDIM